MRIRWLLKVAFMFAGFAALATAMAALRWDLDVKSALSLASALVIAIFAIAAVIAVNWLFEASAQSIFQNWARQHAYTVLHFRRAFYGGFSFWTTSRGQAVYLITIRDDRGLERKAWVRCGSFGGGTPFSNKIEIKWVEEPKTS